MDEFKRKYSNEDTLQVALPHFWEHFDREGYSIWYCQYKYANELTLPFMSCNLISGETRSCNFTTHVDPSIQFWASSDDKMCFHRGHYRRWIGLEQ